MEGVNNVLGNIVRVDLSVYRSSGYVDLHYGGSWGRGINEAHLSQNTSQDI